MDRRTFLQVGGLSLLTAIYVPRPPKPQTTLPPIAAGASGLVFDGIGGHFDFNGNGRWLFALAKQQYPLGLPFITRRKP